VESAKMELKVDLTNGTYFNFAFPNSKLRFILLREFNEIPANVWLCLAAV
jgi:hypothetical protein